MPAPQTPAPQQLTDDEYEALLLDKVLYFRECLLIRTKGEGLVPLVLNSSQVIAHEAIEDQLARTGKVRKLILKGRQQGISTYVAGRFYHKTSTTPGTLAYIVTHEDTATQNLFGMAKRFHEHCLPDLKPETGASNANELAFSLLDSGYKIATAGARTAGRSSTIQCLHASEFDFWPDASADEVMTGLMEALAKTDGTEAIIESTANVPGGRFHRAWKAAKAGQSSFEALFLPWFVHEEYRVDIPVDGWDIPPAFEEYRQLYALDYEQIYWAWLTNRDMCMTFGLSPDDFCHKFKREYPATDEEAFEQAGDDLMRVYPIAWVRQAQARWVANKDKRRRPMTGIGVDIAQGGGDKTALAPLHEVRFEQIQTIPGILTPDGPAVAGQVVTLVRDGATIAVDMTGGWGGDTYTHLKKHLDMPVMAVNVSTASVARTRDGKLQFKLLRDELFWKFREALDPENGEEVELPLDDELIEEMLTVTFEVTPQGIKIMKKDDMKLVLRRSPDKLDSVLLAWRAGEKTSRIAAAAQRVRQNSSAPVVHRQYGKVIGRK